MSKPHPLLSRWRQMNRRCHEETHHAYARYGGRGITVCDEWRGPGTFSAYVEYVTGLRGAPALNDITKRHQIDRIDNDRGYERGNLRWASRSLNQRNKSTTKTVLYNGKRVALADVADDVGMSRYVLLSRLANGWTLQRAITVDVAPRSGWTRHEYTVGDRTLSLKAWAEDKGIQYKTLHRRVASGWAPEVAIMTPVGEERTQ